MRNLIRWKREIYLGGGCGSRSWNDGFVGDGNGQVRVVDEGPRTCYFARLELAVEGDQVRIAVETAVQHRVVCPGTLIGAHVVGRRSDGRGGSDGTDGRFIRTAGWKDASRRFQNVMIGGWRWDAGGGRHLGTLVIVVTVVIASLGRLNVRTVGVAVPVLDQGDGGMISQVTAARTGRRSQTIGILAQNDAKRRRSTSYSAGQRRLLELTSTVVHATSAARLTSHQQSC